MPEKLSLTIGIEEEYMLVDPKTGDLISEVNDSFIPDLKKQLGDQVSPEFLQCQIEVGTRVCYGIGEAGEDLQHLRRTVAKAASEYGYGLIAVSTHPFAKPEKQNITSKARYAVLRHDLQRVARRLLISGMHVHVGVESNDARVDLMSQVAYILPHLLALSTSSPFWCGENTGLLSYRISIWDEMPRTGLPASFESYSEYMRHVQILIDAGIIEDASKIWWDLRPSRHYPTLEMRIPDLCTSIDDSLCIAAFYACWLNMLTRLQKQNQRWRRYSAMLLEENRWRAHRYGINEGLIDFGRGEVVPYRDLLEEMIVLLSEDAEALNCVAQLNHARTIVERGTSAHRQLNVYHQALADGDDERTALIKVVDWLRQETLNFN